MTNVLVTGGAGYIGSHCCKELFQQGFTPITIDNLIYGHKENVKWGAFYQGDTGNKAHLEACFASRRIDAVMHFAAFAYVGESVQDPMKYYANNVGNTLTLLRFMLEYDVKCLVFSSTCATYGNPQRIPIDEAHPQVPINPYGKTKLMIEEILKDCGQAYGLNSICLRYFNAAGADPEGQTGEKHKPETHLIPLVLDVALGKRRTVEVFGTDYPTPDGTCVRDYIHVTDLARAHILALETLLKGGGSDAFNLGQGQGYSVMEVIQAASQITGAEIPFVKSARRPGDPPVLVASSAKAREQLGWQPEYDSLEAIIATAWNWHQKMG
ncbi:MAG: UDP-glucose 4-epimerase GalE [Desulfobacterales bacterium]|nr:MAG: UDP-glucose 4-epimerase GalE [Desulfobacterales bacterium]